VSAAVHGPAGQRLLRSLLPDDVLALAVRWYARYRLSYADVAEWLAERGFTVDRSAVARWVQRFLPRFGAAARRYRRRVGQKWRVDETYCAFRGRHAYIYRAIDEEGQVVDAYFSERRNAAAAQAFFERAITETEVTPERVTTDKAKCYPPAMRTVLPHTEHRRHKGLNNRAENSHRPTRRRERVLQRFTSPAHAQQFLRPFGPISDRFRPRRHLLPALQYRQTMQSRFAAWREVTGLLAAA
jgi:putative transposase